MTAAGGVDDWLTPEIVQEMLFEEVEDEGEDLSGNAAQNSPLQKGSRTELLGCAKKIGQEMALSTKGLEVLHVWSEVLCSPKGHPNTIVKQLPKHFAGADSFFQVEITRKEAISKVGRPQSAFITLLEQKVGALRCPSEDFLFFAQHIYLRFTAKSARVREKLTSTLCLQG